LLIIDTYLFVEIVRGWVGGKEKDVAQSREALGNTIRYVPESGTVRKALLYLYKTRGVRYMRPLSVG
jgi:hypothetical protein